MTQTQTPIPPELVTAVCPSCGRAVHVVPRQSAFCPHCGRRLRAGRRRRWPAVVALLALGLAGVGGAGLWAAYDAAPVATEVVAAADPAVALLDDAGSARAVRLADLDRRSAEVRAARQALVDQTADLSNLSARVTTAVARAADEGRWPAIVAGQPVGRGEADGVLARIGAAVAAERPAVDRDTAALGTLAAATAAVRGEADEVGRLRDELTAGPTPDRRAEIDRRAAALRDASAAPADAPGAAADPTSPVDADALLR